MWRIAFISASRPILQMMQHISLILLMKWITSMQSRIKNKQSIAFDTLTWRLNIKYASINHKCLGCHHTSIVTCIHLIPSAVTRKGKNNSGSRISCHYLVATTLLHLIHTFPYTFSLIHDWSKEVIKNVVHNMHLLIHLTHNVIAISNIIS